VVFHLLLFTGLYFMPEPKMNKAREFVANLVSPEEAEKPVVPPMARLRPLPAPRALIPARPLHPSQRRPPAPPLAPLARKAPPATPMVPGEGRGTGKAPTGEPKTGKGTGAAKTARITGPTKEAPVSSKPGFLPGRPEWDVIGKIVQKGMEGKKGSPDNPITFNTKEYEYSGYMTQLRQKIESIWVYPPEAAEKGIYGDLKIRFTIKKNGRLGAVELVRTSGYKMLDDAALKALKDGEPYWPLPDSWHRNSYTIEGHFVYLYGGYYLR
jgi:protein TonB